MRPSSKRCVPPAGSSSSRPPAPARPHRRRRCCSTPAWQRKKRSSSCNPAASRPARWPRAWPGNAAAGSARSEEHTSELQSRLHLVCRLLLEKKKKTHESQKAPTQATTRRPGKSSPPSQHGSAHELHVTTDLTTESSRPKSRRLCADPTVRRL